MKYFMIVGLFTACALKGVSLTSDENEYLSSLSLCFYQVLSAAAPVTFQGLQKDRFSADAVYKFIFDYQGELVTQAGMPGNIQNVNRLVHVECIILDLNNMTDDYKAACSQRIAHKMKSIHKEIKRLQ